MMPPISGGYPDRDPGERPWNRFPWFNQTARNKLGVTVDLRTDIGRAAFLRLVATADVLVTNQAHGTLERLGVGWDVCREVNDRLVYVDATSFGATGPLPVVARLRHADGGVRRPRAAPDVPRPRRRLEHLGRHGRFGGRARDRARRGSRPLRPPPHGARPVRGHLDDRELPRADRRRGARLHDERPDPAVTRQPRLHGGAGLLSLRRRRPLARPDDPRRRRLGGRPPRDRLGGGRAASRRSSRGTRTTTSSTSGCRRGRAPSRERRRSTASGRRAYLPGRCWTTRTPTPTRISPSEASSGRSRRRTPARTSTPARRTGSGTSPSRPRLPPVRLGEHNEHVWRDLVGLDEDDYRSSRPTARSAWSTRRRSSDFRGRRSANHESPAQLEPSHGDRAHGTV